MGNITGPTKPIKPLPSPKSGQKYVNVSAIDGGKITVPDETLVSPSNPWDKRSVPSLAFLIEHPGSNGTYFLLALVLRVSIELPYIQRST